jgi:basic membrane protein A and related proteins
VIFTTSFGYMNATEKVSSQFPNIAFMHATGYKRGPNMGNYNARFYEGRFLNGFVAGKMSKSGVVGYVAAFPIPEVLQGINAFARGVRLANPKGEVRVQKADVLTHHTDSTAVVQTAEQKGIYSIGYHSDMTRYAPKGHLTATTHHWGTHNIEVVNAVREKRWIPTSIWGGMKEGFVKTAPLNAVVPAAVAKQVKAMEAEILAGKLHPFAGPLLGQRGEVLFPAGRTLTDAELNAMDYYLIGVNAVFPKK